MLSVPERDMGWVTDQYKCTLDVAFWQLRQAVDRDVREANNLLSEHRRQMSSFHVEDGNLQKTAFLVRGYPIRHSGSSDEYRFMFQMYRTSIFIERLCPDTLPPAEDITVMQRWNIHTASCVLYADGKQVSVDQIAQLALEPMFFGTS